MVEQIPPHDEAAERGVLGCVFLEPIAFSDALAKGLKPEWFFNLNHRTIFAAMASLDAEQKPIDTVTVFQSLKKSGKLDEVGGLNAITDISQNGSPSAANMAHFLSDLRGCHQLRQLVKLCHFTSSKAMNGEGRKNPSALLSKHGEHLQRVHDENIVSEAVGGARLAEVLIDHLESRHALNGALSGLATGLYALDKQIDGLQYGEQTIVGARPSQGKTALGLTMANHIALNLDVPTLIISAEMSAKSLLTRLCALHTGVPLYSLRTGRYVEDDFTKITAFNSKLNQSKLFIKEAVDGITSTEAAAEIRRYARSHGVKFVLVDYLQRLKPGSRHEKRTYEVGEISGTLKGAAWASGVALVTLAQLSRESERDKDRAPRMSDLADSSQIERDADCIILLQRAFTADDPKGAVAKLHIAKQRDGETGLVTLQFNGPLTRFENPAQEPYESPFKK